MNKDKKLWTKGFDRRRAYAYVAVSQSISYTYSWLAFSDVITLALYNQTFTVTVAT